MREIFVLCVIFLGVVACSQRLNQENMIANKECTGERAIQIAEQHLKEKKLFHDDMLSEVQDSLKVIIVTIIPGDLNRLGGGGRFVIGRKNCKIETVRNFV